MDNSNTDNEAHQSFKCPPRRRSTFFERRDSIVPQVYENVDSGNSKKDEEGKIQTQQLSRYYEKLLSEKNLWKREVTERRNKYHDLKQNQTIAKTSSSSRMSYSALSNEDIDFLKGKPNISKLVASQQKLHTSIKETMALTRKANELDKLLLNFCEEKVNRITEHILENSTVE